MHDVFVSHASGDAESAMGLVASLEKRGVRCWLAPRDVPPGAEYGEAIVGAIRGSRMVIALVSRAALESPHVRREVERAANLGIPTLPVRLQDISPTGSLEYFLSGAQYIDWLSGPARNPAEHITRVLTDDGGRSAPVETSEGRSPSRLLGWSAAGVLTIVALVLVFLDPGGESTTPVTSVDPAAAASATATSPASVSPTTIDPPATSSSVNPTSTNPSSTIPSTTAPVIPGEVRETAAGWPIMLAEPFSDNDRGWFEGVEQDERGEQSYSLDQGGYVIALQGNEGRGSYYSTIDQVVGSRLLAEVRVTPVEFSGDGACGLVLRMVGERDLFVGVARDSGRGGAGLFVDRDLEILLGRVAPVSDHGTDVVTIILEGTTGYMMVNGVEVGAFSDDRLDDVVAVGLGAQFGDVLRCRFDDMLVRAP